MTPIEFMRNRLLQTGYPVAYRYFNTPQEFPYICFYSPSENIISADGTAYRKFNRFRIELYTSKKDIEAEETLEAALDGLYYTKDEEYIDSLKCYQIIYELEV